MFFHTTLPNIVNQLLCYLVFCVLAADITDLKTSLDEFGVGAVNENKFKYFLLVEPLAEELKCKVLGEGQLFLFTQFVPVDFSIINFLENLFEVGHTSDASFEVGGFELLFCYF